MELRELIRGAIDSGLSAAAVARVTGLHEDVVREILFDTA